MKIGIITLHYNLNYGAVLQAYATRKKLSQLGATCEIINYQNSAAKKSMRLFSGGLLNFARTMLRLKKRKARIKAFKQFVYTELHVSSKVTLSGNDLTDAKLGYDLYITGSDQTFNLTLSKDRRYREAYFLPQILTKKASYGASMGENINYSEEDKIWIRKQLQTYKKLSVREEVAADYICSLGLERPKVVMDPTLLLDGKEWETLATATRYAPNSYILFYSVLSSDWIVRDVEALSRKMNLKVVAPHMQNRYELGKNFIRAEECGPKEFLSLIKNAAFVCTSSFHGTVFSVLFQKEFLSFSMNEKGRISNLLKKLNLEDRIITKACTIETVMQPKPPILWQEPLERLHQERESSVEFLKSILNNED